MSFVRIASATATWVIVLGLAGCSSDDDASPSGGGTTDASAGGSGGTGMGGTGGTGMGGTGASGGTAGKGGVGGSTGGTGGVSGTGGSGGAAVPAECVGVCTNRLAAGCTNDPTQAECESQCAYENTTSKICRDEWTAFLDCASDPTTEYSCNATGYSDINGCDDAFTAVMRCRICVGDEGDEPCDLCIKQQCCTEMEAMLDAPGILDFIDCVDACGTSACVSGCTATYPEAYAALQEANTCGDEKCPVSCGGTAPDAGISDEPLAAYCQAEMASGCSTFADFEDCVTQMIDIFGMISSCGLTMNITMSCYANEGIECTDAGAGSPNCPELYCDPTGAEESSAFWEQDGMCGIGCASWFGSCTPSGASLDCVCDLGPNTGTTFQVDGDCSVPAPYAAIEANCK